MKTAVLGGGAWGTTFATVMADAGCDVTVWARDARTVHDIEVNHRNDSRLPGVMLPEAVRADTDIERTVEGADVVVVAVPSQAARGVLAGLGSAIGRDAVAVSLMKGIELGTDKRMSEVLGDVLRIPNERLVAVSGPNLAGEIAQRQPTATVVAGVDSGATALVARACSSQYFRPYTNSDIIGVELCGAVKNVIALAVGIAQGQGLGFNTTATVITRGLVEITRLGLALGAQAETFAGLAGMGDLVATCSSPSSRNHSLGRLIGEGASLDEALGHLRGTAEAVKSCQSILALATAVGVDMPITQAVVAVLYQGFPVAEMARRLLSRPHKVEGVVGAVIDG